MARARVFGLVSTGLCAVVVLVGPAASRTSSNVQSRGTVEVTIRAADIDSLDPAQSYSVAAYYLVDATCAHLLRYVPSKSGYRLTPETAARFPTVARDRRTFTFIVRGGFRFSDGTAVHASAFARSINRTLAPGVKSPFAQYSSDIVGAERVLAGKAASASGVVARGNTLIVHLKRPVLDFAARSTFFCAVPPTLPADPEGIGA